MLNFFKGVIFYINGDWGLGIGDWAIPNPQSPNFLLFICYMFANFIFNHITIMKLLFNF